jgi:hypothetical protein
LTEASIDRTEAPGVAVKKITESDRQRTPDAEDFETWMETIQIRDIPSRLDWLEKVQNESAQQICANLVGRWAEESPNSAADWAARVKDQTWRSAAIEQIIYAWSDQDPTAALEWLRSLPADEKTQERILAFGYEAARTNPTLALDTISSLSPSAQRDDLLVFALGQWATLEPLAAQAWAMNVTDPPLQQRLVATAAIAGANQAPAASASFVEKALLPGEQKFNALVTIVEEWIQSSPEHAASWVDQNSSIQEKQVLSPLLPPTGESARPIAN